MRDSVRSLLEKRIIQDLLCSFSRQQLSRVIVVDSFEAIRAIRL